jgi:uncharacterized damage-inducible protein DinB
MAMPSDWTPLYFNNMLISAEVLRSHIDYTAWASGRIVEAAGHLNAEELTRNFGTADKSVLGTLVHTFAADRIWMGRIDGHIPVRFLEFEKDMHMHVLRDDWPAVYGRYQAWAAGLTDDAVHATLAYKNIKGDAFETPIWQVVLHVVNHGTHHRGQVAGFLRSMGHTPPPLDLIAYYRQL